MSCHVSALSEASFGNQLVFICFVTHPCNVVTCLFFAAFLYWFLPHVGPWCVLCPRIDPLRFLAGCRRRRLNQGLVVVLRFFSLLDRACFCGIFSVYGCMLCLVRYLFVISTSVIDCLGRFVPEMTYYVSSGTLNLAQLNSTSFGNQFYQLLPLRPTDSFSQCVPEIRSAYLWSRSSDFFVVGLLWT